MKEAFEKIVERLEEPQFNIGCGACPIKEKCDEVQEAIDDEMTDLCAETMRVIAKEIVKEVAEEYNGGWIPCSKRLPEKNGMYLCTQNSYDLATNKNIIRVSTELVEFYNGKWRRAQNLVITHWQPLPKPFKERD